jgi:hypothetical protein
MNINLAGIGWINDSQPHGNRLRWTYPFTGKAKRNLYLGLPGRFFIERTPVNEDLWQPPDVTAPDGTLVSGAWMAYPASWWSAPQDYWLTDVFTLLRLPSPVQAIRFTYHGPATLMRIKDLANQRLLLERQIANNEFVFFASGCIEEINFLGPAGTVHMEDFSFLDLFTNRAGQWDLIAEIDVGTPFDRTASLAEVAARAGTTLLIGDPEWNELLDLVQKARVSSPLTDRPSIVKINKNGPQGGGRRPCRPAFP